MGSASGITIDRSDVQQRYSLYNTPGATLKTGQNPMPELTSSAESPPAARFSRKHNIFYIRLTVILVIAYMLLVESVHVAHYQLSYAYLAFYMATNLFIYQLPESYFYKKHFHYLLAAFDTFMIALGIFLIGQADSYFFIVYFLVVGLSAMSRNIKYLMLNTLIFIIVYGWIMYISGHFHGEDATRYALRLPFIWSFALFLGYILECVMYDVDKSISDLQEKYRSLVQSIDSPIFMLDRSGCFLYINDKMLTDYEAREEEILNKHFNQFFSEEEADLFQPNLDYTLNNEETAQFVSYSKSKGRWFLNVLSPVRDSETSKIESVSVVSKDITDSVESEQALRNAYEDLKKTQDQLIQKNKMEALGRMASGVAHQIRNPLEIILMGVELLEELDYRKDELGRQSIDKIKAATHRINRIIHDVLQFSRTSDFSFKAVDIEQLLEESLEFMQHKIVRSNIVVEKAFHPESLLVQGDKNTLQQVFLNILQNAVEAMDRNGRLSIRTYKLFEQTAAGRNENTPRVVIEIEDNGPGIPEEVAANIFEPFFTTKKAQQGTGLGLSIASLIIDRHQGSIELCTKEGEGTKFKIRLNPAKKEREG